MPIAECDSTELAEVQLPIGVLREKVGFISYPASSSGELGKTGAREQPDAVAMGYNIYLTYGFYARRKFWRIGG